MGGKSSHEDTTQLVSGRKKDQVYKLLLVGDSNTGKSCLCRRFASNAYNPRASHLVGIDIQFRTVHLDDRRMTLQVFDVDSQRLAVSPTLNASSVYSRAGIHGVLLVYDANRRTTLDGIWDWIHWLGEAVTDAELLLVGNKCDLIEEKEVDYTTAKEFANGCGIPVIEVSAKDGTNVELAFMKIVAEIENRQFT